MHPLSVDEAFTVNALRPPPSYTSTVASRTARQIAGSPDLLGSDVTGKQRYELVALEFIGSKATHASDPSMHRDCIDRQDGTIAQTVSMEGALPAARLLHICALARQGGLSMRLLSSQRYCGCRASTWV